METTQASLPSKQAAHPSDATDQPLSKQTSLAIAVDLTPLRPGGSNGGIKPAIFSMLSAAMRQTGTPVVFVFLTNSATHEEVRRFSRPEDLLICVILEPESPLRLSGTETPLEFSLPNPPHGFLRWTGVDLLYAPFGGCTFHSEGVPTVALIADLLHKDYPLTLDEKEIDRREVSIARTLRCASMVQCISRSGIERMKAHYHVPEEKLFFTYLPVQVRLDAGPACSDFVRQQGLDAPYFFYPANLWKHKNHEALLEGYRLYRERAGEGAWDLVLTFHEDERAAAIRALARELGVADHLHCPGYVSEAQLHELWRHAGALVFPSLHEGFGIPLLEAMHYGVPIVTSPEFSLKEIAGDAALLIDPRKPESIAGALEKVSGNAELRESLRCRGAERLGFFDLDIETRKLLDVWSALPRCKDGFPRKCKVLEEDPALAVPTPASDALWTVEVRVNPGLPQNRYSFYLDDAAQGSFSIGQNGQPVFHFDCQPRSRTLRVLISRDRTAAGNAPGEPRGAIREISIRGAEGRSFRLFRQEEGGAGEN
ncbi:MAG: glycosyltransferase family 1 protein [Chthoniobacteraceae bacterium]|nr:glycosyltransferase family 1 protein [Chthoniobacteraceae bacterium]